MNLPAQLFSGDSLLLANYAFAWLLYRAIRGAPWRKLLDNSSKMNGMIGLMFCTPEFWHLNAGMPGLTST